MRGHIKTLSATTTFLALIGTVLMLSAGSEAATTAKNGQIAFDTNITAGRYQIWVMNPNGSGRRKVTSRSNNFDPSFSPGSRMITFERSSNGSSNVWVMHADGSHARDLTHSSKPEYRPSFSPDGKKIVFFRTTVGENGRIFLMRTDGSHVRQLTRTGGTTDSYPSFSPDGKRIVFERDFGQVDYVYVMNADGSHKRRLAVGFEPSFSPDGHSIIFSNHSEHIAVIRADGSHRRVLSCGAPCASGDFTPRFSPDGKKIVFSASTTSGDQIYEMNANGSNVRDLSNNTANESDAFWGAQPG